MLRKNHDFREFFPDLASKHFATHQSGECLENPNPTSVI
jgi:hypothetical protein